MRIADLSAMQGRRYPARRWTRSFVGPGLPIEAKGFSMGYVVLEPKGGQVPWHDHEQEEVYVLLEGTFEFCLGTERRILSAPQAVYVTSGEFHQLTNIGDEPATMIYCYAPVGEVAHWRQELSGALPKAGQDAPPLPVGAWPQCTEKPADA
ncbi:MAG: cupin domain-containing protein [Phycisphaerae bacterium]|nr:cupin domain-containing protein [Phycisphaerae bacterium]